MNRITLRPGLTVCIRELTTDDRDALEHALGEMSERSRYLRFFSPLRHLTPQQLDQLTLIDARHFALVAIDCSDGGEHGIGVARWVRDPVTPRIAEFAVSVIDAFQHKGVGTLLIRSLADAARAEGIDKLVGDVLRENHGMLRLIQHLGGRVTGAREGTAQVELPLPLP